MSSYSMIRQTVEKSNRAENDRRVQLKASQVVKERIKKPTLPPGPEGTEGSRALAGEKRVVEQEGGVSDLEDSLRRLKVIVERIARDILSDTEWSEIEKAVRELAKDAWQRGVMQVQGRRY